MITIYICPLVYHVHQKHRLLMENGVNVPIIYPTHYSNVCNICQEGYRYFACNLATDQDTAFANEFCQSENDSTCLKCPTPDCVSRQ